MTNDAALIEALKAAGYDGMAKNLADRQLANALRESGHPELADALAAKSGGAQQPATQPEPRTPEQTAGEDFVRELKQAADAGWTSSPGLLDK